MSNEKLAQTWWFRGFVGDEVYTTQLCGDYFISHYYEDPVFNQPVLNGK